ncbi:Inactive TPR repeat-containing thioredoxin TTL3 [Sesamum alatum]|uniref:Inactive TPR repeat-containing thioredoxin TTL3 n=1 Tax=Sesamum alatum TaxID=300844 RepID=A0AAE1YIB5_9LAMI|nr:Inactive TPR repeat-containing thioredoxin TTL3 [Sesamum alatum]
MGDISPEKKSGCGLLTAVFGGRGSWTRKLPSSGYAEASSAKNATRSPDVAAPKTQKAGHNPEVLESSNLGKDKKPVDRIIPRPGQNYSKPVYQQHQPSSAQQQNQARNEAAAATGQTGYGQARKVPQTALEISGELESMISDHQKSKGAASLVRASSSNVMLYGNLGNLRQPGDADNGSSANVLDYLPRTATEEPLPINGKYSPTTKNVANKNEEPEKKGPFCRVVSTRMDPEQLKILGNEDYKNGKFAEAVALYDAAIAIDPNKASYRSNKSAALTAMGKLLEAAFECREAIRIDPFYQRAHNRLATLYVRLGEAERAVYHFKQAGSDADPDAMNKAQKVQIHLNKCTEAKTRRDWNSLLKETSQAIAAGADSAPLIFALRAEALLKLNRQQGAIETMMKGPNFNIDECKKFFGPFGSASLLLVHAQVDMVEGRFDDAVSAAELASRLDPNNREANIVLRKTRAVATARSNGNKLFKTGKYPDACSAYEEGLNHDPHNAVLLSNRAACWSRLSQYDKAIEDCNASLNVRPSYSKARLRRADCYAKIKNWGACVQDCEVLIRENPDDEEVGRLLKEAKGHLKQHLGNQDLSNGHAAGMVVT